MQRPIALVALLLLLLPLAASVASAAEGNIAIVLKLVTVRRSDGGVTFRWEPIDIYDTNMSKGVYNTDGSRGGPYTMTLDNAVFNVRSPQSGVVVVVNDGSHKLRFGSYAICFIVLGEKFGDGRWFVRGYASAYNISLSKNVFEDGKSKASKTVVFFDCWRGVESLDAPIASVEVEIPSLHLRLKAGFTVWSSGQTFFFDIWGVSRDDAEAVVTAITSSYWSSKSSIARYKVTPEGVVRLSDVRVERPSADLPWNADGRTVVYAAAGAAVLMLMLMLIVLAGGRRRR